MKLLKTIMLLLCILLVAFAIICVMLSLDTIRTTNEIQNMPELDFFTVFGATLFIVLGLVALLYIFLLSINIRSVKKGRGKILNTIMLVYFIFPSIYALPFSVALLTTSGWSDIYGINLFISLLLTTSFICILSIIYSISALVCSRKNEKDLDKEKEDQIIRRIGELQYRNPYNPYNPYGTSRENHEESEPRRRRR